MENWEYRKLKGFTNNPRMKYTRVMLVITLMCLSMCCVVQSRRVRRRLDEFGEMILVTTNKNPMKFNGYGNWCGIGGSGETVDSIDECCKVHDMCYLTLNNNDCHTLLKYKIYTTSYTWSINKGNISCDTADPCGLKLCTCDRTAAKCFGEHKQDYNPKYKQNALVKGISRLLG